MFFWLLDLHADPLFISTNPDSDSEPSINKKKDDKNTLISVL
jgi:hypothetical protein